MPNDPEPTVAQLQAEISKLKEQLSAAVPGAEADKIRAELAAAKAELAELKKPAPVAPARPWWKLF